MEGSEAELAAEEGNICLVCPGEESVCSLNCGDAFQSLTVWWGHWGHGTGLLTGNLCQQELCLGAALPQRATQS